jgi:hypothetical protein
MWLRRTFHECAEELKAQSDFFRSAYFNRRNFSPADRQERMVSASERGVEVLRILALSIRADQDAGLTDNNPATVGSLRVGVTDDEITQTLTSYRPPYTRQRGFKPLTLRQALNKIAHADSNRTGFYVDADTHDLILTGTNRGDSWLAVISLLDLCRVIKSLPDAKIRR